VPNRKKLIASLKKYKNDQSRENFENVLQVLGLKNEFAKA